MWVAAWEEPWEVWVAPLEDEAPPLQPPPKIDWTGPPGLIGRGGWEGGSAVAGALLELARLEALLWVVSDGGTGTVLRST